MPDQFTWNEVRRAQSFLASRRGKPAFVGAKRILKELYEFMQRKNSDYMAFWVKSHLHRVVGNSKLNTVLSQIEACIK